MGISIKRPVVAGAALGLLALLGVVWVGLGHGSPKHPSVLLITIDTLRADHCSAYGYSRPTTPRLVALARNAIRCEVAYAPMSTTGPSHATMFTGLLPRSHGVLKNGQVLSPELETLAEVLGRNGYQTAAFVSSFVVDHSFGLGQGFSTYDDDFSGERASLEFSAWAGHEAPEVFDRPADATRSHAVAWLRDNGVLDRGLRGIRSRWRRRPFFLWVHFFDPHGPYVPPEEHRALFPVPTPNPTDLDREIAAYDGEIHFVDGEIGRLLDELAAVGRLDETLTIVTGDHGEGLMDHGHMHHGLLIYEEAVRVPLILHWPDRLARDRAIAAPVQLLDLAPTVLDLVGVPFDETAFEGRSLKAVLEEREKPDPARVVYLQRRAYESEVVDGVPVRGDKYGLRLGRWKYIAAQEEGTRELYDLESDPQELRNLLAERPRESSTMALLLARWLESPEGRPWRPEVSEEDDRRLRSLGYVR